MGHISWGKVRQKTHRQLKWKIVQDTFDWGCSALKVGEGLSYSVREG